MWQYPTWIPTIQAQTLSRELFWSKFNCDRMQDIIYKFSPLIHCHDTVTLLSLLFKQIKTITVFKLWPHGFHFGFMVLYYMIYKILFGIFHTMGGFFFEEKLLESFITPEVYTKLQQTMTCLLPVTLYRWCWSCDIILKFFKTSQWLDARGHSWCIQWQTWDC